MGRSRQSYDALNVGSRTLYEIGLTLVHPFYGEVKRFNYMYDNYWNKFSADVKDKLDIILVDDCGTMAIHTLMENRKCDFNLAIYRINEDIKYNAAGAFNLGALLADTEYVCMLDSDSIFTPEDMIRLMEFKPESHILYKFERNRVLPGGRIYRTKNSSQSSSLICKSLFTRVGMYDEDFNGEKGGYGYSDYYFRENLGTDGAGGEKIIGLRTEPYFCRSFKDLVVREYMDGEIGTEIYTTDPGKINRKLWFAKIKGEVSFNYKKLNFPWECVYFNRIKK